MVLLHQQIVDNFSKLKTCKLQTGKSYCRIPVVDLLDPVASTQIVDACQELGFFKLINHGVPFELIQGLEAETIKFFNLPQVEKQKAGPANPFGYGNKRIGRNGDVGWIEYLLFKTNPDNTDRDLINIPGDSETFWYLANSYISAVRKLACEISEMIAEGLNLEPKSVLTKLLNDEKSDTLLRLNHYPPCPERQAYCQNLIGFGEHTDPQIISILRSNNTSGLQISLKDGTWVSVPPDPYSFFINVGDTLQVLTNGRFRSVRHRVVGEGTKSRLSMIYLAGPPPTAKIAPLPSLMDQGEESLYEEYTWSEYKKSAYKTKLGDNRLGFFEKSRIK